MPGRTNELPPIDPLQRYTLDEVAAYLRISRARVYQHINAGRLATVRDGARQYCTGRALADMSATSAPSGTEAPAA